MFQIVREPDFAERVKTRRVLLAINQSEAARKMKLSRQHWNNWEFGYAKPKGQRLKRLAALLQCDPVWLEHGDAGEIQDRLHRVSHLMRLIVRDLDHIHRALEGRDNAHV